MMNRKGLAIASVVAVTTLAVAAVGYVVPQAVFAGGYHHHYNNNHRNTLRVDQQTNQQNSCTGGVSKEMTSALLENNSDIASNGFPNSDNSANGNAVCINSGDNTASVHG